MKRTITRGCMTYLLMMLATFVHATSYSEFTDKKERLDGYFPLYIDHDAGKVYVDVVRIEQPFLFQTSLPRGLGSNDIGLDRGQLGETRIVQFEQFGDKVLLRQLNTYYRADSDNAAERLSVREAFTDSVVYGFKPAFKDDDHLIIDYTPFLLTDIHGVSDRLQDANQGGYSVDSSRSGLYTKRTKSFEKNTEIEAMLSMNGSGAGEYLRQVAASTSNITVHTHHSLVELPEAGYKPRVFHPYSGFWSIEYADYASAINEPMTQRFIPRHRLSKKDASAEVSEAVEPIIYYLDPGAPEPVKTALLEGARWWNTSFEAIGYKDAFQVKMLPEDADPMDLRYNVIQWVHRSTRGWSYGSSVIDPRTGEIIKGHVTLGSLRVRQDYLIAQGLLSPFTDNDDNDQAMQDMALARIRQLSAHEVGHTLGIAHNFAASEDGRVSVMDYPHPLVKIEGEAIVLDDAYGEGVGSWDDHVIAYGYSDNTSDADLAALIAKAQKQGLGYMSDPDARSKASVNPKGHLWDNGTNAAEELGRVLKVRELALSHFGEGTIRTGTPYSQLEEILVPIYYFHRFQTEAAAKAVGGVDYRYDVKTKGEAPYGAKVVPGNDQQQAIDALLATLDADVLTLNERILTLIPPKAYGYRRTRESAPTQTGLVMDPVAMAEASAEHTLSLLLHPQRLNRLAQQSSRDESVPSVLAIMDQLITSTVMQERGNSLSDHIGRRIDNLVVEYVLTLAYDDTATPEVASLARLKAYDLQKALSRKAFIRSENANQDAHLFQLFQIIKLANERSDYTRSGKPMRMPPGSPI